jgi:formamidopyrimidine-DNA glycosylase
MPELPDVEVFRRYLESTSLHQEIRRVEVPSPELLEGTSASRLKKSLQGSRFTDTRRHGKLLFGGLENGGWLVLHFGMTGFLSYFKNGDSRPPHARLLIRFPNGYALAYDCQRKLGKIALTEDPDRYARREELGPDALGEHFDLEAFRNAMKGSRATVKSALMDQKRMAGIGNIYSDEILFQAGIRPDAKVGALSDDDLKTVFDVMVEHVLPAAIEAQARPDRFPSSFIIPHRRGDGLCPKCGRSLRKRKISGRTSYFCTRDQRG